MQRLYTHRTVSIKLALGLRNWAILLAPKSRECGAASLFNLVPGMSCGVA